MEHGHYRVLSGEELDAATIATAVEVILQGDASPAQIAGFLVALRAEAKPPLNSPQCLTSCSLTALRFLSTSHNAHLPSMWWEPVATDRTSVNVSTMATIVAAGAGAWCANTAIDRPHRRAEPPMLEELGVNIGATADTVAHAFQKLDRILLSANISSAFRLLARHDASWHSDSVQSPRPNGQRVECSGR